MRVRTRQLPRELWRPTGVKMLLTVALFLIAACSADPAPSPSPAPSPGSAGSSSSATSEPDRILARVVVTRAGRQISFAALWTWGAGRSRRELVTGTDTRRERVPAPHEGDLREAFPDPEPSDGPDASQVFGQRLLAFEVPSLRPRTRVVIGGGDGATLLPFQKVAISEDWDDWWVAPLPHFEGERAYVSGAVALADGRLVALLEHFSDDRRNRPAGRHHGLWASHGADWSGFTPMRPRFAPPLARQPDGWSPIVSLGATRSPNPVVWVTTWDQRLYVSTDQMRTFRQLDAR